MAAIGHSEPPAHQGRSYSVHVEDSRLRVEMIRRLRQQVETGCYDAPVEELVDRLVSVILSHQATRRTGLRD